MTENDEEIALTALHEKMTRYKNYFDQCDINRNGLICIRELDEFINSSRGKDLKISKNLVKDIHKMADQDGDRTLNFKEFVDMMEHPDLEHIFGYWMNRYVNFIVPRQRKVRLFRTATIQDETQYFDEFSCCPPPLAMFVISIFEFIFFLTDELTEKDSTLTGTGVTAVIFIYDPFKRHEVWRYLTYMFVHIGYLHLCVNLFFQILLGVPLEMVHKWWRILLVYFAGVIAGSLATSITDPWVKLAGASGGVYALLTAHIATIIMNWKEMTFPAIQILIFGIISACDIGSAVYERYWLNKKQQVGYAAHIGGAVAGLLVGIYILRNLNKTKTEKYIWWFAVIFYVTLMGIAIVLNFAWPGHFATN